MIHGTFLVKCAQSYIHTGRAWNMFSVICVITLKMGSESLLTKDYDGSLEIDSQKSKPNIVSPGSTLNIGLLEN